MSRLHELIKRYFKLDLRHGEILNLLTTINEMNISMLWGGFWDENVFNYILYIFFIIYIFHGIETSHNTTENNKTLLYTLSALVDNVTPAGWMTSN